MNKILEKYNNEIDYNILTESIMSYAIQAGTLAYDSKSNFDFGLVSAGPHFYTGILQASAYLLLKNKEDLDDKFILIFEQSKEPDEILTIDDNIANYMGKTYIFPELTNFAKKHNMGLIGNDKKILKELFNQLGFMRIITKISHILPIFIGKNVGFEYSKEFIKDLKEEFKDHKILFVSNLSMDISEVDAKMQDNQIIKFIKEHDYDNIFADLPLVRLFVYLSSLSDKPVKNITYLNTADLGGNEKKTNGYICCVS